MKFNYCRFNYENYFSIWSLCNVFTLTIFIYFFLLLILGDNYEIEGLIPAGNYTFKFKTYPPSGQDEWSRPYRVILLPAKPEVIFRTIDSGTVKLEWVFKFEDRMRKTIDRHEISYFTVSLNTSILYLLYNDLVQRSPIFGTLLIT